MSVEPQEDAMSEPEQPTLGADGFEAAVRGDGGEVPMPSVAAKSRGRSGERDDQEVAEEHVTDDRRRVAEGYVHPGEPHTD
jgi:hypothetical protein